VIALLAAAQVVGVLEFRDKVPAAERIDASYLSDQVRAAVKADLPGARVITRENMLVLLQAAGKDLADCEGECEVETGRRIGADLVVSGELLRFGTQYKLNLKLHDVRSAELLAGVAASGATADELDRNLRPSVDRLLEPLVRVDRAERRQREPGKFLVVGGWIALGYDTADPASVDNPSGVGWHAGAQLFFRLAGPLYAGGLFDYSFSHVEGPIVAGALRAVIDDWALSAGFGYGDQKNNGAGDGLGALAAIDFGVGSGFCLRAQGTWRRSVPAGAPSTVLALSGGVAYNF